MTKTFKTYLIFWIICFAVYNIITFCCSAFINVFTTVFWVGYIFTVIAFICQLACSYIAFMDDNPQKTFYNVSLLSVSYFSLAVIFVAGGLCMAVPLFPVWLGAVLCVLTSGISACVILSVCFAIDTVSGIDKEIETKTFAIKKLTADAEHLLNRIQSNDIKRECKKVYNALRYSDPMSNAALYEINEQIQRQFDSFESAVNAGDAELSVLKGNELLVLVDKRNKQCKLLK